VKTPGRTRKAPGFRWALLGLTLPALLAIRAQAAEDVSLPPWRADRLPIWARSARVLKGDQPVFAAPDAGAPRRGSVARDVHLPLFGARDGPGCGTPWLHVGPQAWACGDEVAFSAATPVAADWSVIDAKLVLPFSYFFAGPDGSLAYRKFDDVDFGEPEMRLEPGFAVAIVEQRRLDRELYGRTNRDLWVPMRDLGPARPMAFQGAEIQGETIDVAWVVAEQAALHRRLGQSFTPTGKSLPRFTEVAWLEEHETFGQGFARIDDDHWIRARDLRHPTIAPPPDEPEIAHGARWIDIELATQTLVAFEGSRPVFATLVSTGKGTTKGHPFETPKGVHRIWVKLLSATMDNLEDEHAGRYWRIEDVPYVQFFHEGVGLHGAFWHRSFGRVRSHGCVNLTPLDAKRLFTFTQPHLPAGWTAALPTAHDRGTIVRVR
jgi:hypothetical protein